MNNAEKAIIKAYIDGILKELHFKTSAEQVYLNNAYTLASKLAEIVQAINIRAKTEDVNSSLQNMRPHIGDNGHWFIGETDTGIKAQGEDGANGKDGVDGYTPQKGVDYFDGADGKDGAQGIQGEKGDKGDKGEQGDRGEQGAQGIQGEKGDKGDKGDKGTDGTVAFNDLTDEQKASLVGVHVGSDTPPDTAQVWVDYSGNPSSTEKWKFTLEDGTTVTKTVVVV